MGSLPEPRVPTGPVQATLNFFNPPADASKPFNYVDTPPKGEPQFNFSDDFQKVTIHDLRGSESKVSLDTDAVSIIQQVPPSKVTDWTDEDAIKQDFYPEVEKLLLDSVPGSNKIIIFDHTIRLANPKANRNPVLRVHIDQTAQSAAQRVRRHASSPEEADTLLQGRYRIINVWRPLNKKPVESFPLAFASSASLRDEDVVPVEHRYSNGYTGQTAGIKFHPEQKWYYLSGMTGDERLLLECFDSEALNEGSTVAGGRLPHTAFVDPRTREDAEGRESIEVRALVFGP